MHIKHRSIISFVSLIFTFSWLVEVLVAAPRRTLDMTVSCHLFNMLIPYPLWFAGRTPYLFMFATPCYDLGQ